MITNVKTIIKSVVETDLNGRIVFMTTSKEVNKEEELVTEVVLDNYDQRESLEKHLKKNKYKMSDGFFGKQEDFSVGSSQDGSRGFRILVTIQAEDVAKHNAMRECVKDWANVENTKRMKKNARRK